ncbi:MAG: superoxide dismutase family protein [Planctomycetota bacterium]
MRTLLQLLATLLLLGAMGCHSPHVKKAVCVLNPTQGNQVQGTVTFTQMQDYVLVEARVTGLSPGKHGFHIHEFGDLTSADGTSTGSHFNPTSQDHAGPSARMRHSGDMGNIHANQDGMGTLTYQDPVLKMSGPQSIIGRGMIVHAKVDDLKTQPTGNAGARVASGVIGIAKP